MNRVLVVNDSKFESIVLNDILSQLGYNVVNTDEYEAISKLQSFSPDIVLVNYIMRDTSGDKLAETIKSKKPEIKCLLTSSNQLSTAQINTAKVDAVLKTPVTKFILENAIRKLEEQKTKEISPDEAPDNIKSKLEHWRLKTSEISNIPDTEANGPCRAAFCPHCGNKLGSGDCSFQFCPYCGKKI